MKIEEYIRGARHGKEAHELELESMRDPLLADALDGFDAVPGDHSGALERLGDGIRSSAAAGRAAARSRSARLSEKRVRGWSVAAATVFLAGVVGGGAWLLRDGISTDTPAPVGRTGRSNYGSGEVVAILPPGTVIKEEAAATPPTDLSDVKLDREEVSGLSGALATAPVTEGARDTVTTVGFRRWVYSKNIVRSAVLGPVTLSFEIDAGGRPRNVTVVESSTPELAEFARTLLVEGPDWPLEPSRKFIIINL